MATLETQNPSAASQPQKRKTSAASVRKEKDVWDKLDIIGKLISGVILALIAFFLKTGSERISHSLQKGDLVRNLIADLTSVDSRTRQDVALIALHYSIGEEDSLMVSEIAERLYQEIRNVDSLQIADENRSLGSIAFTILEKRNPKRAEQLKKQRLTIIDSLTRSTLRSQPTPDTVKQVSYQSQSQARLLARTFDNLVFIQFRGNIQRAKMEQLRQQLEAKGYNAPGVERVNAEFKNYIRYFHQEDKPLADSVAFLAEEFFSQQGRSIDFKSQDLSKGGFNTPKGQVELWVNY